MPQPQRMVGLFYNCTNRKRIITDTKRSANDTQKASLCNIKTEDYRVEVFLHCLSSTCSKMKLITINILFNEDKTIGRTPYTYSVAGHMEISLYSWVSSYAVYGSVSLLSADIFLTIISVKILQKCDETSLRVTRNAVSLTLKR